MKLAIFLAPGYEEGEAVLTIDILRRAGIEIEVISTSTSLEVISSHKVVLKADKLLNNISYEQYGGFILPGGMQGVENLSKNEKVLIMLKKGYSEKKLLAAVCAAPQIFGKLGFLKGLEVTSYPGCVNGLEQSIYSDSKAVVVNDNIITGASVGSVIWFALAIVKNVLGNEAAQKIEKVLVIRSSI